MAHAPRFSVPPEGGSFADYLRAARENAGLSQRALAAKANELLETQGLTLRVNQGQISSYEAGRYLFPSIDILTALERALNLPERELWRRSAWTRARGRRESADPDVIFIANPSPTLQRLMRRLSAMDEAEIHNLMRRAGIDDDA